MPMATNWIVVSRSPRNGIAIIVTNTGKVWTMALTLDASSILYRCWLPKSIQKPSQIEGDPWQWPLQERPWSQNLTKTRCYSMLEPKMSASGAKTVISVSYELPKHWCLIPNQSQRWEMNMQQVTISNQQQPINNQQPTIDNQQTSIDQSIN